MVRPRMKGFIALDAHPTGCARRVAAAVEELRLAQPRQLPTPGPVVVLGASGGYALPAAFRYDAPVVAVCALSGNRRVQWQERGRDVAVGRKPICSSTATRPARTDPRSNSLSRLIVSAIRIWDSNVGSGRSSSVRSAHPSVSPPPRRPTAGSHAGEAVRR